MPLPRKLVLLATLALAVAIVMPSAASAQEEPVEVTNEIEHCQLTAANCEHHSVGAFRLDLHAAADGTFIAPISSCESEFIATLDEDGSGLVYFGDFATDAPSSASCSHIQCNDVGYADWDLTDFGEYTGSQTEEGHFTISTCFDHESNPSGPGFVCNWELQVHNHGNHNYGFEAENVDCPVPGSPDFLVRFNGDWESEFSPEGPETDIEVIH